MTNKIELIRQIIDLSDEGIFDSREVIEKIKLILRKPIEENEMPELTEVVTRKRTRAAPWKRFSQREDNFITKNFLDMTQDELAGKLGRSDYSIRQRVKRLKKRGIIKGRKARGRPVIKTKGIRKYNKFTPQENAFIRNNYKKMSSGQIARVLGRAQSSIWDKIQEIK